jgi:aryl-alcohol dehydrogenase-like predicted oxidoreductase
VIISSGGLVDRPAFRPDGLVLGLGLISIGRVWGVAGTAVPDEVSAQALLTEVLRSGIGILDTAPAYGTSEARLGAFLKALPAAERDRLTIMTKVGEHWDHGAGTAFADHSYDAMARSLDDSFELLGRIDVLQLHKASEEVIVAPDTERFFAHARNLGIGTFGASVSSVEAGRCAVQTDMFTCLQFPLNAGARHLEPLLADLQRIDGVPIINRPFAMGAAVHGAADKAEASVAAFRFLRQQMHRGVVLTGTGKAAHLRENLASFAASA